MNQPKVELSIENIGDITVVNFVEKRLNEVSAEALRKELALLVGQNRKIILNMHGVNYITSTILGVFVCLRSKLKGISGDLAICNADPQIKDIFKATALNKLFNMEESQEAALRLLSN